LATAPEIPMSVTKLSRVSIQDRSRWRQCNIVLAKTMDRWRRLLRPPVSATVSGTVSDADVATLTMDTCHCWPTRESAGHAYVIQIQLHSEAFTVRLFGRDMKSFSIPFFRQLRINQMVTSHKASLSMAIEFNICTSMLRVWIV